MNRWFAVPAFLFLGVAVVALAGLFSLFLMVFLLGEWHPVTGVGHIPLVPGLVRFFLGALLVSAPLLVLGLLAGVVWGLRSVLRKTRDAGEYSTLDERPPGIGGGPARES